MKKSLIISLIFLGAIGLTACNNSETKQEKSHPSSQVTITPTDDKTNDKDDEDKSSPPTSQQAICDATANPINQFIRIETHYGSLLGQPHIAAETGGLLPLTLINDASEGDLILELNSTVALIPGQLITYLANNLDYYVARIDSINGTTITLDERGPVVSGITKGQMLWNFYDEPTHPNAKGFNAIADFSYRSVATSVESAATHVMFGDSWFSLPGMFERFELRFPDATIINKGQGGNNLCDLLARFDTDVAPLHPNYVWINSSINDYYGDVSQADYKLRLQDLISKIQAIGATAIVIDPAPLNNGSNAEGIDYLTLSQRYATQVLNLHAEALGQEQPD